MKNGTTMTRSYTIYAESQESGQPGTTAYALEQLLADRDLVWQAYYLDEAQALLDDGGQLTGVYYSIDGDIGDWPGTISWGPDGSSQMAVAEPVDEPAQEETAGGEGTQTDWDFYGDDAQELWDAMLQDFQDGTIGMRDPWGGSHDWSGQTVTFYVMSEAYWRDDGEMRVQTEDRVSVTIAVPSTAVNTLAALEELGAALGRGGA